MRNRSFLVAAIITVFIVAFSPTAFADDCGCAPGTGTPGYWKNHADSWPVAEITIGGILYTKAEAIEYMEHPVKTDKTYTLFAALVAAKLNVIAGNRSACVACCIDKADEWMGDNPVGSGAAANEEWQGVAESCYLVLDNYNNGLLCAPSRDVCE